MNLIELELSVATINTLQNAGIEHVEEVIEALQHDPTKTSLALAKIKYEDFLVITEAIAKRTENVLDNP
tara:strand:- start:1044 stop:1250 length:207 start_codon:yes stop_codon:yes gene_type:complete